jgi:hypothetical protein
MSTTDPPGSQDLKAAMKAFKKRLKVLRLDDESGLTRNPLTYGRPADIVAITPPDQFPQAVWDELVKQGRLKKAGRGMYELVQD